MGTLFGLIAAVIRAAFCTRADLILENLALRQQLAVLRRQSKRPRLRRGDRIFWLWMMSAFKGWASALVIVKPETGLLWHRWGFRYFWRWKSRNDGGRPGVSMEIRRLVQKMASANPLWGAPRIHGELERLGIDVSERTVSRLMPKRGPAGSSQSWRTFLANHMKDTVAMDFFVVTTVTFRLLYVLVVISHERRKILCVGVTAHPTSEWTAAHLAAALVGVDAPRYLVRDRDGIYSGEVFARATACLNLAERPTAPRSPWQNPYVERVIGTIRRELTDHIIVLDKHHLTRRMRAYATYYNRTRTHLSLVKDAPESRPIEPVALGPVREVPEVGGLHHRYTRWAA